MTTSPSLRIGLRIGLQPELLVGTVDNNRVMLTNQGHFTFQDIRLTISYFDHANQYIDFEDVEVEPTQAAEQREIELNLAPPGNAMFVTIDISGQEQTFLKRHWKLLSTIMAVTWGLIVVARRLAP
jgi:threonyl-tRNA synthetase